MGYVIHKYEVGPFGQVTAPEIPRGAAFLHVDSIGGRVFTWARIDEARHLVPWRIGWFTTGQQVPDSWFPVGSFLVPDALGPGQPFVGHVFEGGGIEL